MSWFEKAKTVLIEALDIQDDANLENDIDEKNISTRATSSTSESKNKIIADTPTKLPLRVSEMVTKPSRPNDDEIAIGSAVNKIDFKNNSDTPDSIAIFAEPISSPKKDLPINNSESCMELITESTENDIDTLSNMTASGLPDSIVVLESFKESNTENQDSVAVDMTKRLSDSTKTLRAMASNNGIDSDSTQSFEDIKVQVNQKTQKSSNAVPNKHQSYSSTSSDIEVICNANGDYDSTNCNPLRNSPLKLKDLSVKDKDSSHSDTIEEHLKTKGHYREVSEISFISEDSQTELDKLVNHISELNQIIEAREQRLLQSERQNAELLERNEELLAAIDAARESAGNMDSNEAVQRLSALEKKFQNSIRESDILRIQIESLKNELQDKIPKDKLTECNEIITALQIEGEKLSKEILQQSNIIKKLRAKEKTSDLLLKKNCEQISQLLSETERLKKSLTAKDDVERSQIEAVYKMSSENQKLKKENNDYRSNIEDLQSKLTVLQLSFDSIKNEYQQFNRNEKTKIKAENNEHSHQLNELMKKLRYTEQTMTMREQKLREENRELLKRLETTELRVEFSAQEASVAITPLIKQIESLQKTLDQRTNSWNKEEQQLSQKIEELQTQLKSMQQIEILHNEKYNLLHKRCSLLEEELSNALLEKENATTVLSQLKSEVKENNTYKKQFLQLNNEFKSLKEHVNKLEQSNHLKTEQNITKENQTAEFTRTLDLQGAKSTLSLQDDQQPLQHLPQQQHPQQQLDNQCTHSSSTISFDESCCNEETMVGIFDWQTDDFDCVSNSGKEHSTVMQGVHLNLLPHSTTTLEHLQSLLKQREGELTHMQWELSRLKSERSVMSNEISKLTVDLETVKEQLQSYEPIDKTFNDLQHRYNALLEMYGEKVERTEELELDLLELKQAYKLQIDELLSHSPPNISKNQKS